MEFLTLGLLLGSVQGILLSIFLFTRSRRRTGANFFLGLYLLFFSLNIFFPVLIRIDYKSFTHLLAVSFPLLFLIGPLMFFYIRGFHGQILPTSKWVHILPSMTSVMYLIPFYLKSNAEKTAFYEGMVRNGVPPDMMIIWGLVVMHILTYQFKSLKQIDEYEKSIKNLYSFFDRDGLSWVRFLIWSNLILWTLYLGFYLLLFVDAFSNPLGSTDILFGYVSSIFNYTIAYRMIHRPQLFLPPPGTDTDKYYKSGLTDVLADQYVSDLKKYMEKTKPYLDSELSLQGLADALHLNAKYISQVINDKIGLNFYDFVNQYRVNEVKHRMSDPKTNNPSLLSLAFDCGFKSKSTFNSAFKRFANMTPTQFKKKSNAGLKN